MSKFTDEQKRERVNAVIDDLYEGISLVDSFKRNKVACKSFYQWLDSIPDLAVAYARAEKALSELDADQIVNVAFTEENPNTARNKMEALKWRASKRNPKKYGDRIEHNLTGSIDLHAVLKEANERILLPVSYSEHIEDAQLIETKHITHDNSTGFKPVDDNKLPDLEALEKMRRDLLS